MRVHSVTLAIATGLVAFLLADTAHACSIRGQYCGYPSWAANMFEGRYGFKGDPRILTDYYPDFSNRKAAPAQVKPRKKRH